MAHRGVDWPVQAIGWPTRSAKTVDGRRPLANRAAAVVQHNAFEKCALVGTGVRNESPGTTSPIRQYIPHLIQIERADQLGERRSSRVAVRIGGY